MDDSSLPLSARPERDSTPPAICNDEIERLVEHFYQAARADEVLGPVFEAHVADWDTHLATMRSFWSAVIYKTGTYAGNPLRVHAGVPEITPAHFERWLALWTRTVNQVVRPAAREAFLTMARRMGASMSRRLGIAGESSR